MPKVKGKNEVSREGLRNIEKIVFIDKSWALKEYKSLSPEARELVNENVNQIFWLKNPGRFNKKLDPDNPKDKPYIKRWLNIRNELIGTTGREYWEAKASEDRKLRREILKETKPSESHPYWVYPIRDKGKLKILKNIVEKIKGKIDGKAAEPVSFTPKISNMTLAELGKLEKSVDNLLMHVEKGRNVTKYKDLGVHKLMETDIYTAIVKSMDSKELPDSSTIKENIKLVKEFIDPDTIEKINAAIKQYKKDWNDLIKLVEDASREDVPHDQVIINEVKNDIDRISSLYKDMNVIDAEKMGEVMGNHLLRYIKKSPGSPDSYRYAQKFLDDLESRSEWKLSRAVDNVAGEFLYNATGKDLAKIAYSPGGKEFLVRCYDELTRKNLYMGGKEEKAAGKLLKTMATFQNLNDVIRNIWMKSYIFPFKTSFLDAAYITAEMTKDGNIRVKMKQQTGIQHDDARRLLAKVKVWGEGIILKPEEFIGVRLLDKGSKVTYMPALYLLNLHKQSRDGLIGNYITSAVIAMTALLGASGITASEASTAFATIRTAQGFDKLRKILTVAAHIGDHVAMRFFILGVAAKEFRGQIIDTFKESGRNFVKAVEILDSLSGYYGMGRLVTSPIVKGIDKYWKECKAKKPLNQLSGDELMLAQNLDDSVTQLKKWADRRTGTHLESGKGRDVKYVFDPEDGFVRFVRKAAKEKTPTAESLMKAEKTFKDLRKQVAARKKADLEDFEPIIDPEDGFVRQYSSEHGVIMYIEKSEKPGKKFLKLIEDYPEREWELLKDVNTNEYFLVHGDGNWNWGEMGIDAVLLEFRNRNLKSIKHYHPRQGQMDYEAIFPSIEDYIWYFDSGLYKKGMLHKIVYKDYITNENFNTYITKLPSDYRKISAETKKILEEVFGKLPGSDAPYIVIYRDPITGRLKGKQFKTLEDYDDFLKTCCEEYRNTHREILNEIKPHKKMEGELPAKPKLDSVKVSLNQANKIIEYGYKLRDILRFIDTNTAKGFSHEQTGHALKAEIKALDYLKNKMCDGSVSDTKNALRAANFNIVTAVRDKMFDKLVAEWKQQNPNEIARVGTTRLLGFLEKATKDAADLKKSLFEKNGGKTALNSNKLESLSLRKIGAHGKVDSGEKSLIIQTEREMNRVKETDIKQRHREKKIREEM